MFSVVLVDVWMFTPFIALLLLAGLRSLPVPPFEAAKVDGASNWFVFRNLTLPMLMPYIFITIIFRLVDSLRAFDIPFAMTKGGPGDILMTYQITAFNEVFTFLNVSKGAAYMLVNWVLIYAICFVLVGKLQKWRDRIN
jgi:multiple sugar transport system permease protein